MNSERKIILLRAAYDILKKCHDSDYVQSPMETTVFYDGADCDGFCLMEDIACELELKDQPEPLERERAKKGTP